MEAEVTFSEGMVMELYDGPISGTVILGDQCYIFTTDDYTLGRGKRTYALSKLPLSDYEFLKRIVDQDGQPPRPFKWAFGGGGYEEIVTPEDHQKINRLFEEERPIHLFGRGERFPEGACFITPP